MSWRIYEYKFLLMLVVLLTVRPFARRVTIVYETAVRLNASEKEFLVDDDVGKSYCCPFLVPFDAMSRQCSLVDKSRGLA